MFAWPVARVWVQERKGGEPAGGAAQGGAADGGAASPQHSHVPGRLLLAPMHGHRVLCTRLAAWHPVTCSWPPGVNCRPLLSLRSASWLPTTVLQALHSCTGPFQLHYILHTILPSLTGFMGAFHAWHACFHARLEALGLLRHMCRQLSSLTVACMRLCSGGRCGAGMEPAAKHGAGGGEGHAVPALTRGARAAPRPQVRQPACGQALARQSRRLQPLPCHERLRRCLLCLCHQPQARAPGASCASNLLCWYHLRCLKPNLYKQCLFSHIIAFCRSHGRPVMTRDTNGRFSVGDLRSSWGRAFIVGVICSQVELCVHVLFPCGAGGWHQKCLQGKATIVQQMCSPSASSSGSCWLGTSLGRTWAPGRYACVRLGQ